MKRINIEEEIGKQYGRLTILSVAEKVEYYYKWKTHQYLMNCQCECGNTTVVNLNSLRQNRSKSCGCYNSEISRKTFTTHGLAMKDGKKTPEYTTWLKMKQRCHTKTDKSYPGYGGRGITVCDRWKDKENGFKWFLEDMGEKPSAEYSIERVDVNGNYCPENCKWILKIDQPKNTRKTQIEYKGEIKCLADWCKELGLEYSVMRHRVYDLGISLEESMKYKKKQKISHLYMELGVGV
jgi:hypothetical protein